MMFVAVDAVGIRDQGGATVLRQFLSTVPQLRPGWKWHVFLFDRALRDFETPTVPDNVVLECVSHGNTGLERLRWVDRLLPRRIADVGADLVFAFANIGAKRPSTRQVVFLQQMLALSYGGIPASAISKRIRLRILRYHVLAGARASKAVMVQTNAMKDGLTAIDPRLEDRVHVVPSSWGLQPSAPKIRKEKADLILNASHPRVIYVSAPRPHKKHSLLFSAWKSVLTQFPTATLLITVGREEGNDTECSKNARKLTAYASNLGVDRNLVWLGQLLPDEVGFAFEHSDLQAFPSEAESFGLPLIEAMALGCPNLAADLHYARNVLGEAGIFFEAGNASDLANKITNTLQKDSLLEQIKVRGVIRAREFSPIKVAERTLDVLEGAMAI